MPRPRRQLAIVHRPQFPAHRLERDNDPVFPEHPLAEIDEPPAHDAVHRGDRAILHHASQRHPMLGRQPRPLPPRLAGNEPGGAMSVELENPIPNDLKRHAADLRRFRPPRPIVDCSQRQKPPRLAPVLRPLRLQTKLACVKICPKRNRHRELNRSQHRITAIPIRKSPRVTISGSWYKPTITSTKCPAFILSDVVSGLAPVCRAPPPTDFEGASSHCRGS